MSKKYISTLLLFAVFIGFLWWGLSMLTSNLAAPVKDGEAIVYSVMILGCAFAALVAILLLPRRRQL
jgi:TRAP-type C4-dicarboxylate transport system permease small subunit